MMLQALSSTPATPVVRVPANIAMYIQRVLDTLGFSPEAPDLGAETEAGIGNSIRCVLRRRRHSTMRSARTSTDGGIVKPSAFAVFRLMISSSFVGCSNGRLDGFPPLRILSA